MEGYIDVSRLCKVNGLSIDTGALELLRQYVELLLDWNSKINLVSRKDEDNIWIHHILHSLSLLFHVEFPESARILDLGTGGGLPGIPLAIVRRDLHITLLDSIKKKTLALEDMVSTLRLENVDIICGRAGELKLDRMKSAGYDVVVARAVAHIKDLIKWSLMLTRKSNELTSRFPGTGTTQRKFTPRIPFLIALKGGNLGEEVSAARMRFTGKTIMPADLSIKGLRDQGLVDKKIVIIEL